MAMTKDLVGWSPTTCVIATWETPFFFHFREPLDACITFTVYKCILATDEAPASLQPVGTVSYHVGNLRHTDKLREEIDMPLRPLDGLVEMQARIPHLRVVFEAWVFS